MTHDKWVVEVEESVLHVRATDRKEALSRALQLIMLKAYPKEDPIPKKELVTVVQSSCIDQKVIEALTDTELYDAIDRINKELDYRLTDFLETTDYCGVKKED